MSWKSMRFRSLRSEARCPGTAGPGDEGPGARGEEANTIVILNFRKLRREGLCFKCQDAKMPRCQDAKIPRCQDAKMPRCQDAKLPRCQDAKNHKVIFTHKNYFTTMLRRTLDLIVSFHPVRDMFGFGPKWIK